MGFWIFMIIMDLLFPLVMVLIGKIFVNNPPKEINGVYGYRTYRSMKNKDTWEFAHHYFGKLWITMGWIILFPSVIVMLFVIGKDKDVIGDVGSLICILQLVFLIYPIFPTERALKRNFDEYGNKKY